MQSIRAQRAEAPLPGMRLYLWCPEDICERFVRLVKQARVPHRPHPSSGCLVLGVDRDTLAELAVLLDGALGVEERAAIRVLVGDGAWEPPAELPVADYCRLVTLGEYLTSIRAEWLTDMLDSARITCHFQPIVHASDTSVIFAQEALLRGIDDTGRLVPPRRILEIARATDMIMKVDLAARLSAIREAGAHAIDTRLFLNFSPASIDDPTDCFAATIGTVDAAGLARDGVVLEVLEADYTHCIRRLRQILDLYRGHGFQVALDDVGAGYSSLNLIHELRPDFVKLDMGLTRGVAADRYKGVIVAKLLEMARDLGISTVAEGIEELADLGWLRERGVDYLQGYAVARPTSPPARTTPRL